MWWEQQQTIQLGPAQLRVTVGEMLFWRAKEGKLARWDCPGLIAAGDWAPSLQVSGASSSASHGSSSNSNSDGGSLLHWHTTARSPPFHHAGSPTTTSFLPYSPPYIYVSIFSLSSNSFSSENHRACSLLYRITANAAHMAPYRSLDSNRIIQFYRTPF